MTWLAWRQFRVQAAVALLALAVAAVVVAVTGSDLHHLYDTSGIATCKGASECAVLESSFLSHDRLLHNLLGPVLLAIPAVLGTFWGAPLLARELESGTYRLAWTQGITRTRWLAVKVALVGLVSVAVAELFSLLVTWWFSPIDRVNMDRFAPEVFDERGIVAIGYAAFAFALGVAAGAVIRRTLPAMATTLLAFVGVRLLIAYLVRPHLISPAHTSASLDSIANVGFIAAPSGATVMAGDPSIPNAWVYSGRLVDAAGRTPTAGALHTFLQRSCPDIVAPPTNGSRPAPAAFQDCIGRLSTRFHEAVTYQPAGRYWSFQASEMAIFLVLALLTLAFCFWWVRHRLS